MLARSSAPLAAAMIAGVIVGVTAASAHGHGSMSAHGTAARVISPADAPALMQTGAVHGRSGSHARNSDPPTVGGRGSSAGLKTGTTAGLGDDLGFDETQGPPPAPARNTSPPALVDTGPVVPVIPAPALTPPLPAPIESSGGSSPPEMPGGGQPTMAECMSVWAPDTAMTKAEWRATCVRTLNGINLPGSDLLDPPPHRTARATHTRHRHVAKRHRNGARTHMVKARVPSSTRMQ
jgi:hypothetical protein